MSLFVVLMAVFKCFYKQGKLFTAALPATDSVDKGEAEFFCRCYKADQSEEQFFADGCNRDLVERDSNWITFWFPGNADLLQDQLFTGDCNVIVSPGECL